MLEPRFIPVRWWFATVLNWAMADSSPAMVPSQQAATPADTSFKSSTTTGSAALTNQHSLSHTSPPQSVGGFGQGESGGLGGSGALPMRPQASLQSGALGEAPNAAMAGFLPQNIGVPSIGVMGPKVFPSAVVPGSVKLFVGQVSSFLYTGMHERVAATAFARRFHGQ